MTDLTGLFVFKGPAGSAGVPDGEEAESLRAWSVEELRSRERAERAAAKQAKSLAARLVHQQLAQHYADLLRCVG
jgi:hypothetical protein